MEKSLVTKKLSGCLAMYFIRPRVSWERCVRHLLCCYKVGDVVPAQAISQHAPTAELVLNLNEFQLRTTLWFSTTLIEEVSKVDLTTLQA